MRDRERLRSFLRRERLRLLLRERDLLPSSAFSALLERERLLLFETDEASESSSRAIFCLVRRGDGVCGAWPTRWICLYNATGAQRVPARSRCTA